VLFSRIKASNCLDTNLNLTANSLERHDFEPSSGPQSAIQVRARSTFGNVMAGVLMALLIGQLRRKRRKSATDDSTMPEVKTWEVLRSTGLR